jgi:hypothetical protein
MNTMKKISQPARLAFILLLVVIAMMGIMSCQDDDVTQNDEALQAQAKSSVETAHQIVVNVQEVVDITSDVLSDEGISIEETNGNAESCPPTLSREYVMDTSHYDTTIYVGTIVLDYGSGNDCADKGTKREGSISNFFTYIINYKTNITSSVRQSISFHNFQRNNVQLDGTIRSTGATGFADTLEISAATTTLQSGQSISWSGTLANQQINSDGVINGARVTTGIDAANTRILTGKIHSSTIDGKTFTGNISKAIRCNYECSGSNSLIPVSGVMQITLNGNTVVLDYGNGSCDRNYTVTINNNVKSYTF